jgi:hypothetical protein
VNLGARRTPPGLTGFLEQVFFTLAVAVNTTGVLPGMDHVSLYSTRRKPARQPEAVAAGFPIRRIPGLRNAIEPLNRIIRIRADAAGGFDDSARAPDHSVAFLHGFAALTQTCQR